MTTMSPTRSLEDSGETLGAFERAMSREAHNLSRWPELAWQQLHNRLQWEDDFRAFIVQERELRSTKGLPPWLRMRFPFAESRALRRTLAGHTGAVYGCAISSDASFIVSVGADWTVKIWDVATGTERATLLGHTELDTSGIYVAPHPIGLNACAISPDGSFIVSAGYEELKVWDARTGYQRATLLLEEQVRDCVISPDGSFIVSANQDWTLDVWDVATWERRAVLKGHRGAVAGCAISPNGSFVVSGSQDGTVKVWDPEASEARATFEGYGIFGESGCALSPDAVFIVFPAKDNTLKAWDVASGEERATMHGHSLPVRDCAVSPDGSFVVSASSDGTLNIWDSGSGDKLATLRGQGGPVNGCAVSPDGTFIVSAGGDGTVKIWDAAIKQEPARPRWHRHSVRACAMGADGSFIASGGDDGSVRVWDATTGEERAAMEGHSGPVNGCAVAPDGSFIVSAAGDFMGQTFRVGQSIISKEAPNALKIWPFFKGVPWRLAELLGLTREELESMCSDAATGLDAVKRSVTDLDLEIEERRLNEQLSTAEDADFVRATRRLGLVSYFRDPFAEDGVGMADLKEAYRRVADRYKRLKKLTELGAPEIILDNEKRLLRERLDALLVKAAGGIERAILEGHSSQVNACAVSPDGTFIVSASDDATLKIWDVASGEEHATLKGHTGPVAGCAVSPDGSYIVSAGGILTMTMEVFDRTLRVWDVASLDERAAVDLRSPPLTCAVSPDGSFIVSGSYEGMIEIWDAATLRKRAALRGHTGPITGCAVSPDGALVVSTSRDGTLRLWDLASGWSIAGIPLPGDPYCLTLDPRSPMVACGDEGGSLYMADLIGIEYGPIVVTAFNREDGSQLRCPFCFREHPLERQWLGEIITCPTERCGQRLRVNPQVARTASRQPPGGRR